MIKVLDMVDEMYDTAFIGWIISCVNLRALKLMFCLNGKYYRILGSIEITKSWLDMCQKFYQVYLSYVKECLTMVNTLARNLCWSHI